MFRSQNVHVYKKNYLCQWLNSYVPVAGRITHNVNKWNNYYSFNGFIIQRMKASKWGTLKIIHTNFLL